MMNARVTRFLVVLGLATLAPAALADETPEPGPPQVVLVDFASIPLGTVPPTPAATTAPASAPKIRVLDLKVEPVVEKPLPKPSKKRLHKKKGARAKPPHVVEIKPVAPGLGVLYVPPDDNVGEFEGEKQRMACDGRSDPTPLRWEKLSFLPDGSAQLRIDDLWFDPRSCSLWPGSTSVAVLKPIAFDQGKPWLFAVRDAGAVTFVMPPSNEMTTETMVGAPLTIRGGFTRVTMPMGRWGSGSMLAALPALKIDVPAPAKRGEKPPRTVENDPDQGPVELTVELVQTMAERYPTLLVRTREAVATNDSVD
jgi:hypothetical protein